MPSSTSSNTDSHSNPGQSADTSQHHVQPAKSFKSLFRTRPRHDDTTPQMLGADTTALGIRRAVPDGHEHSSVDIANDIPRTPGTPHHDSLNPPSMQAEGRDPLPSISEPATTPVATQFQGAPNFPISNSMFTNITVHNYDGTNDLKNLKDFVSFAALHDSEQDPPGIQKDLLSRLRDWVDNPNVTEPICWVHGPAGAGKSAIAQTIAHGYKQGEVAATFFFYRSDAERNNGNRLFPTIAWQLAFSIPAVKDFIVHALDETPHLPRKDIETQFEQLVAYPFESSNNITSQLSQPAPVVIIDGLDECSDEGLQRRILAIIGNAVKDRRVPLRFLISSRPEALIEEILDQFKDSTLRIDLARLEDSNRDVRKYLGDQFSAIRSKRRLAPTWPGPEIIEEIVFKASGNFIFTATVMRLISDEDCDPEEQLDIVLNLKPYGGMSPFALLDELYLDILKRQRDQNFLMIFLALLIGRSSIEQDNLHEDDAILMNVSERDLRTKLRKMRSLLNFEPFIDVYHISFLDFLQDPSRSGQYHVSKQGGQKRYLELIVVCVLRHVSMAIEHPNDHEICRSAPKFVSLFKPTSIAIQLPPQDWKEILRPIYDLHRDLNPGSYDQCSFFQVADNLLLHLTSLRESASRDFNTKFERLAPFVSFAALYNSADQDLECRCHPATRKNILKRLRDWFDNPTTNECISWLHGPAGAGKSAIAQTIADEYKERGVAATFFYRSDAERNDGNRLFPTLAWQLASSIPAITDFIVHALDETPHLPRTDVETQFEQLVVHPFHPTHNITSRLSQPAPVVIIDGLDKCPDEELQRRILTAIGNAVKDRRVPLRFLFCSRPEAQIEEILDQFTDCTFRIDLATLDDSHRDIEKYLVDQFSAISSKRGLDPTWPGQEIIEEIIFESSGNIILPSTLIRCISDEDYSPESQLDIIQKLKPPGKISLFALLDELYLEILKRQPDQDFLKTFLSLLIGRSSINESNLHKDDAILMNISEIELVTKLQTMRSLLKFEPCIDVYHKSFLDFLQESSRSGQYHVTEQCATRLYVELVVNSIVQNVSRVIQDPDYHSIGHFAPEFVRLFKSTSIAIQLSPQDWEEILHPVERAHHDLRRKLNPGYCGQCRFFQVTDDLLLHLNSLRQSASGQQDFNMNFGRWFFGPAAILGPLLIALA